MNYDKSFCVTRNAKMYVTLGGLYSGKKRGVWKTNHVEHIKM